MDRYMRMAKCAYAAITHYSLLQKCQRDGKFVSSLSHWLEQLSGISAEMMSGVVSVPHGPGGQPECPAGRPVA